ncbi:MAG: alanine--tRNA ligase [Candidatus Pacebacteria bacterium]|nr:alanine--tRNA ligase [Candidatus Paceibacterota bacterium]MBT3511545.1 alanine--tRNA ligase [Candidatus Paceibacterota bacterium]MBT4680904.1 alanine--tRNA ligase [Candidatus Paceibacterota bacterium]MBT7183845.1 alanine--tRNA ligase [Candidatus Paceibacterota bacterium]MBT7499837.1 alanine--tRNA ligase [Candidatus Paceibacterota bacterium]
MTPDELRQAYLDFFVQKKHAVLPSDSLVPDNDPTTLFTGSGMQPLLPYFLGQPHPKGTRVVNSQKCFRSQDIEEVGDNRHTTFFEMLGNWSFGDYFKKEQLEWIFEFFTDICGLNPERLFVTAYEGNQELGIARDEEAAEIWKDLFAKKSITDQRVYYYGNENWWSRVGEPSNMSNGEPGGPDSEIFYDFGIDYKDHENSQFSDQECHLNCDCGRYLEIGNNVFMTYVKTASGFKELEDKNIDFGGGFERILAAMNNDPDVFKTELFMPIISYLEETSGKKYNQDEKTTQAFRVIADHMKAAVMLAADGVYPSNKEQGYFSRRLIRRAIRYGQMIGIENEFVSGLVPVIAAIYQIPYPKVIDQVKNIQQIFATEEKKFQKALTKGLRVFEKEDLDSLTSATAFNLYESYGFPLEMSIEEAQRRDMKIEDDIETKFNQLKQSHADKSRQASTDKFKGGLGDQSEATVKYHTATHLLHAALRKILGTHVEQKGSNINGDRLRFDFSHPQALTKDEINQIEAQINTWIKSDLPVIKQVMSKQAALNEGAVAFFIEKYPDEVTVYTIEGISKELCGGPHVGKIGEIGQIMLFKEQSCSAGVRRVYAKFK